MRWSHAFSFFLLLTPLFLAQSLRGCSHILPAAIARQGQQECWQNADLRDQGSLKSWCLMKILIKQGNKPNPNILWHENEKCEISINIPLFRAEYNIICIEIKSCFRFRVVHILPHQWMYQEGKCWPSSYNTLRVFRDPKKRWHIIWTPPYVTKLTEIILISVILQCSQTEVFEGRHLSYSEIICSTDISEY